VAVLDHFNEKIGLPDKLHARIENFLQISETNFVSIDDQRIIMETLPVTIQKEV